MFQSAMDKVLVLGLCYANGKSYERIRIALVDEQWKKDISDVAIYQSLPRRLCCTCLAKLWLDLNQRIKEFFEGSTNAAGSRFATNDEDKAM